MPYALLNEKKLSEKSFENSYIKEVDIPEEFSSNNPVTLITPHGSFMWQQRDGLNYFDNKGKFHSSEQFNSVASTIDKNAFQNMSKEESAEFNAKLDPAYIRVNLNNNPAKNYLASSVILPLKKKKIILNKMSHLKEEHELFLENLQKSNEIYLIGKNFKDSDLDIAEDIKHTCSKSPKKHIVYIDPASCDPHNLRWVEYHNCIFNASTHKSHKDLPHYIAEQKL